MLSATESQKLQKEWEEADVHLRVLSSPGYELRAGVARGVMALCHEVRALTVVLLAGQR
jgi:hypothetical protein